MDQYRESTRGGAVVETPGVKRDKSRRFVAVEYDAPRFIASSIVVFPRHVPRGLPE